MSSLFRPPHSCAVENKPACFNGDLQFVNVGQHEDAMLISGCQLDRFLNLLLQVDERRLAQTLVKQHLGRVLAVGQVQLLSSAAAAASLGSIHKQAGSVLLRKLPLVLLLWQKTMRCAAAAGAASGLAGDEARGTDHCHQHFGCRRTGGVTDAHKLLNDLVLN